MAHRSVKDAIEGVSAESIRRDLFRLCRDPLPFRKVNYARPGASMNSLEEADGYIAGQLASAGCKPTKTLHRVQAYRCDRSKPLHQWYSKPAPEDPWHDAANVEACLLGAEFPAEIVQLVSHKDSMSWIDSPGAHDNAAGTAVNLELARVLAKCSLRRSVRFLFCNEEHTPWTSWFAAEAAAARGDGIFAVLNVDSLGGKSDEDAAAGKMTHAVCYSTEEGGPLAEFVASCAKRYGIDLEASVVFKERVNDDDGMFIKAGFRRTVMNVGSFPYADSQYHLPGDVPERVDVENLARSAKLLLAAVLEMDAAGESLFKAPDPPHPCVPSNPRFPRQKAKV